MLDSNKVKKRLTTENVIELCCTLQDDRNVLYDAQGHPIFNTCLCHGGDSDKLYYYPETQLFHCYTCGDSYDIFSLVQRAKGCEFRDAFRYIVDFFQLRGFRDDSDEDPPLSDDWDIFQRIKDCETNGVVREEAPPMPENLLEFFYPLAAPQEWQRDGISPQVMRAFGIRIDSALQHIIIPHRNVRGELIGIRRRSYDPLEVASGKKYMPVMIEGDIYRHSLGSNLFGLYENQRVIHNTQKVLVAESEKSVLQLASMYGLDQCWAVATCGSSFSQTQMSLLLELGVSEVVLGFDHEFTGGRGADDTVAYEAKLLKVVAPLLPYVNVSVIMDYNGLTKYKDSPTDCGREIFEQLYHQRIRLYTYDEKRKTRKRNG